VTLEAIIYGLAIGIMIVGTILWFSCFTKIMTSDKIIYIFGKVLPKISLIITMALRFIPRFKKQMKQVGMSQKTLGMFSKESYFDRIKFKLKVFVAVLGWSIENSVETADSMRSRGYGLKSRTSFSVFKMRSGDVLLLVLTLALTAVVFIAQILVKTSFQFYPKITGIQGSLLSVFSYCAFGFLSILPFILETMEDIKWKYLISKI
ncbi:MAG: energy-coupling factor transporter transmembrane protein EcfT, partial [Clostridiales bacterium]|nr:energy-coupling factor transporter transmembrane protein EcfT [Clostridiales bacterium]